MFDVDGHSHLVLQEMNAVTCVPTYPELIYQPGMVALPKEQWKQILGFDFASSDCTITWFVVRRPVDITASRTTSSYLAALMVEDFVSTSSSTPLSSVPLQM